MLQIALWKSKVSWLKLLPFKASFCRKGKAQKGYLQYLQCSSMTSHKNENWMALPMRWTETGGEWEKKGGAGTSGNTAD